MSSGEEAPVSDKLRALIERKRAYYEKFEGANFGEANKILAGHILQFCVEMDAALAAGDRAAVTDDNPDIREIAFDFVGDLGLPEHRSKEWLMPRTERLVKRIVAVVNKYRITAPAQPGERDRLREAIARADQQPKKYIAKGHCVLMSGEDWPPVLRDNGASEEVIEHVAHALNLFAALSASAPGVQGPQQCAYWQGRLDEFKEMKTERPIDPCYWDMHHLRNIEEKLAVHSHYHVGSAPEDCPSCARARAALAGGESKCKAWYKPVGSLPGEPPEQCELRQGHDGRHDESGAKREEPTSSDTLWRWTNVWDAASKFGARIFEREPTWEYEEGTDLAEARNALTEAMKATKQEAIRLRFGGQKPMNHMCQSCKGDGRTCNCYEAASTVHSVAAREEPAVVASLRPPGKGEGVKEWDR